VCVCVCFCECEQTTYTHGHTYTLTYIDASVEARISYQKRIFLTQFLLFFFCYFVVGCQSFIWYFPSRWRSG